MDSEDGIGETAEMASFFSPSERGEAEQLHDCTAGWEREINAIREREGRWTLISEAGGSAERVIAPAGTGQEHQRAGRTTRQTQREGTISFKTSTKWEKQTC